MIVDDTLRLVTIARGDVGNPIAGRPVAWETSSPNVLTVSPSGLLTAVGAGAANVTATVEGVTGMATVTVSPRFASAVFASVTAGSAHTCALTATGTAHCWGRDESGQLGVPPPPTTCLLAEGGGYACGMVPFPTSGGLSFVQLTAGEAHTCGLTIDGSTWCWGSNSSGQLGDHSLTNRTAPVAVATAVKFTSIEAGYNYNCGLTGAGAAWCWGANGSGQLGDGTTTSSSTPVQVILPAGVTFQQLAPGGDGFQDFVCALASGGKTYCWGANGRGELGRGTQDFDPHPNPAPVSGSLVFTAIATGFGDHVCALTAAGDAYCWGGNSYGELGDGGTVESFLPLAVSGGLSFRALAAGAVTCGLTITGAAYCWGYNSFGSVGDGSTAPRRTPVAVAGGHTFESISVGSRHVCARTTNGTVFCWGSGRTGQLGTNSTNSSTVPVKVGGQP